MVNFCTDYQTLFNSTILPITAMASIATSMIIALAYMVGNAISNPKLTLWAKTEAVQIVVSAFSVVFILVAIGSFCSIKVNDLSNIFQLNVTAPGDPNMYDAASSYLSEAALYAHNAMTVVRYHLEAYTVLAYVNAYVCDYKTGSIGWGCIFGYSGENQQPLGGYGAVTAALNIFFNGMIMAHFTALNNLFILLFVYKGFAFLFLPMGVFLRSMPYMRTFGSLMIALAMSFLIVYPMLLGIFYLMRDTILDAGNNFSPMAHAPSEYNEKVFPNNEGTTGTEAALEGAGAIKDDYFGNGNPPEDLMGVLTFSADAFVAAVFLPMVALLATIASVAYIARLFGEEIDLSRLTQLV